MCINALFLSTRVVSTLLAWSSLACIVGGVRLPLRSLVLIGIVQGGMLLPYALFLVHGDWQGVQFLLFFGNRRPCILLEKDTDRMSTPGNDHA